jgi:cytochrome c oxidase assembly protein subunit 11
MNGTRLRNTRTLVLLAGLLGVMVTLVVYSPTLYQMFCAATGYGGTVQRAVASGGAEVEPAAAPPQSAAAGPPMVTVYFDSNVAPGLDWDFRPEQRKVETAIGEPTKIYYYARNRSDQPVVARATFNVTPYKAAPYFFKIQCFCFTEERLDPGESARMPVVLYVDEQILKDPDTVDVHDITLSYTFFKRDDVPPEGMQAARDLKRGSAALDATLEQGAAAEFENDAPRE